MPTKAIRATAPYKKYFHTRTPFYFFLRIKIIFKRTATTARQTTKIVAFPAETKNSPIMEFLRHFLHTINFPYQI